MSIYKKVLGDTYNQLHPKLQERYHFSFEREFQAEGVMKKIRTGKKWMYPFLIVATRWNFLFPESGDDIPFKIVNRVMSHSDGSEEVHWNRIFHFPNVTRHFSARMTIDTENSRVSDYLGDPSLFYSDLFFQVNNDGSLSVRSGRQRLVLGRVEIPIPKSLYGNVHVVEAFDDKEGVFTISVRISNQLIGMIMQYEGCFSEV
ncbi:DUF4166 domain-containing protein [Alkalicoccobacillus porphyridii]|uniref:DUF4166 domain-containing protein n=1 Tax=Alkalicoccobacillus porphyridii TaxID=2597270 RepID=A0A554A1W0_9BACI|nr:DUF4166 domain-containing protein [Alkalicoccobacillus porphyridii]TSB47673.1 DUF4166 domain-containing protein [Alkalicoccobacillus porphyridii]